MLTINRTANIPANVLNFCEDFMHSMEKYNGSIYLGTIGRFMLLVKSGQEERLETAHLVKPVRNALEAAQMGLCAGAAAPLWASYRKLFGKKEELQGAWSDENAVAKGGINVDDGVFMYRKPAVRTVEGHEVIVHGDHSAISFASGKCERIEATMYPEYKVTPTTYYNGTMSRVLSEREMLNDARYNAEHKKPVYGSDSDRLHDMREWLDEQHAQGNGENAEDEMLIILAERAERLFKEAARLRMRLNDAQRRMDKANERTRKMLGRDYIDLDIEQRKVYREAITTIKLRDHLEQLIVDRLNGGFEEQNFEFGGQVREVCNMWQDAFDMRDTSATERLNDYINLVIKMHGYSK